MYGNNRGGRDPRGFLAAASLYPNSLALLCTDRDLYMSGPSFLWYLDLLGTKRPFAVPTPIGRVLKQAARFRFLQRLGRLNLRELIRLPGGELLGIFGKGIVRLARGSQEFETIFQVKDGGRPKGLAITPKGHIFVGEYRMRRLPQPLRIWASTDNGLSWNLAHVLRSWSAKHIHNLVWDQYRQGLWILTGDHDEESAFLFTADEFTSVAEYVRGEQLFRACHLICHPEGLYYGTDSERAQNWFVFLDTISVEAHMIQPLPGSCIHTARMAGRYFLSTAVEPSKVNFCRQTELWCSLDLHRWERICGFQKDRWPGFFGFGRVILPRVQGECPLVVFSPIAVTEHDLTTFVMQPEALDQFLKESKEMKNGKDD